MVLVLGLCRKPVGGVIHPCSGETGESRGEPGLGCLGGWVWMGLYDMNWLLEVYRRGGGGLVGFRGFGLGDGGRGGSTGSVYEYCCHLL